MKSFALCYVFVWGIMGKCELFLFVLKIILSRHKVVRAIARAISAVGLERWQ